ncbi:MAG: phosphatase PAP2 family protein [Nitrospirae bacterium]|nr:MAG: phosphatase PAP2 family protein [Nitrospirota bacterium]
MFIEGFDLNIRLFRWVNSHHTVLLDWFFKGFSYLGTGWVLPAVVAFLVLKRDYLRLKVLAVSVFLESTLVYLFKKLLNQPRPGAVLDDVHLLVNLKQGSFPSGDTALAAVLAVVFSWRSPNWVRACLALYVILIGYGRMYLGVHFPLDVLVGVLLGLLCGVAVLWTLRKGQPNLRIRDNTEIRS